MNRVCSGATRTGSNFRDAVARDMGSSTNVVAEDVFPEDPGLGEEGWDVMERTGVLRDWI